MTDFPRINKIGCLGSGASGTVYKAEVTWPLGKRYDDMRIHGLCAIKEIPQRNQELDSDRFSRLVQLQSKNIIRYLYHDEVTIEYERKIRIIMEFCYGGNLKDYLKEHDVCYMLLQQFGNHLSRALNYLDANKIIHTDIKSANIFLTDLDASGLYRSVKLGDLDDPVVKKDVMTATNDIATYRGTCWYFSPEMAEKAYDNNVKVGSATDWWSLGCVLYEMAFGFESFLFRHGEQTLSPSNGVTQHMVVKFIKDGGRPVIRDCCKHIKKALERCFKVDPKERAAALKGKLLFEGAKDLDNVLFDAATPSYNGCTKHKCLLSDTKVNELPAVDYPYHERVDLKSYLKRDISHFSTSQFGYTLYSSSQYENERAAQLKSPRPVDGNQTAQRYQTWVEFVRLCANAPPLVNPDYQDPLIDYLKHFKRNHVYDNVPVDIECNCSHEQTNPVHVIKSLTLLGPIVDIITHLEISSSHGCSLLQLKHIALPSLLCLTILDTVGITVDSNAFAKFPKLKLLLFIDCSFAELHDNFLSQLKKLEFFGLTHSVQDNCNNWKATGTIGQSLAVSSRHSWLYEYLSNNTELVTPKSVFTHVEKGFYRKTECLEFPWKDYSLDNVMHALECSICMTRAGTASRQNRRQSIMEKLYKKRLLLRLSILAETHA